MVVAMLTVSYSLPVQQVLKIHLMILTAWCVPMTNMESAGEPLYFHDNSVIQWIDSSMNEHMWGFTEKYWGHSTSKWKYSQISNISHTKSQTSLLPISSCCCLCPIHWSKVMSREWRCSWSSADRRCSNYIWVINNFIAQQGRTYIRGLTVVLYILLWIFNKYKTMPF